MVIAAEAVYEDGVLRLKQPLPLADKTEVRVTVEAVDSPREPASDQDDIVGFITNGPDGVSLAADHDHYLYGAPRR